MASGKGSRSSSGFTSFAPCRQWKSTGSCRFGSKCKFSHDQTNGGYRQHGVQQATPRNQVINPEIERLQAWRRLRPKPAEVPLRGDRETANYFRTAVDLVEENVSLAQEVVKDMASERRLFIIRDVIEGAANRASQEKVLLWESRILPFFRILLHPSVVDSVILEQETSILFRSLLGLDATRLRRLCDFLFDLVDHWAELPFDNNVSTSKMEALALACGVLAKVINTSTSNMVNSHFTSIIDDIQLRLETHGIKTADFHAIQANKYLDYVRQRLGLGQSLPDATQAPQSSGSLAEFTLSQDLPGSLSRRGRRHDNDHACIADIKLMPTLDEILSSKEEYLPTSNPAQHHLQGLQGLVDRHFRLLREDTLYDLRNAIRTSVESNVKVREVRTRIVPYERVVAVDVSFGRWSGLEFIVKLDQPRATRGLDKMERAAWWVQNKRLADGSLVCIVDEIGNIFFFQVSRSTIRDAKNEMQQGVSEDTQEGPRYSLPDDQHSAYVHLHLVDTSVEEVQRSLLWLKTMGAWQYRRLFEFPSILLPAFAPPLKSLQKMSQTLDLPFQNLLTLRAGDRPVEIEPPLYSMRPGFSFDLSCLSNDGTALSYTPGEAPEPLELSQHSSLDLTQSEAILNSLRRSFALIQGPPGTGKSYTGEALIKVLLANKPKAKLGPIMCVCYTNHALDQLLEHLLDGGVKNIVRIGSRSKSERLGPVNMREVVKGMTRTKMEGKSLYNSIETLESDTTYIRQKLSTYKFLNTNEKIRLLLAEHHRSHHDQLFGSEPEDEQGWQTVRHSRKKALDEWLSGGHAAKNPRPLPDLYRLGLSDLSRQERAILYQDWLHRALAPELDGLSASHEAYQHDRERNNRIRSSIDLRCLQQANIIGVTTSGLATNLDLLRRVQGKVLVCEEAGEVLEAHLLTALLPTVEHAVLIGDHLQLRPQIQDWRLQRANPAGVKYSLDMSLFERLVQPATNTPGLPFSILDTQRRMHPSISDLVRSTLYPSLSDSDGVRGYPEVCGMAKRLFWLHHESPESGRNSDQESIETSYSNEFEIQMVSALVSHLLWQGVYKSGDIAVLTPYLGQLNKLRQKLGSVMQIVVNDRDMDDLTEMGSSEAPSRDSPRREAAKTTALHEVRAATVDNFQGEEAKVIIVSLVRSNNEKRCGFLSTSNRINVLLSRAKHGMYIIGNSNTSSHVPMWAQVTEILQNGGNFGKELELQCPRHPENRSFVSRPEHMPCAAPCDWIPCTKRCMKPLGCGHQCPSVCGERCPNQRFCQVCASEDNKDRTVDFILMGDYRSTDLDEEPCIFPDCGHFLTYTTMDGLMGIQEHYELSPEGVPVSIKTDSHPFSATEIKVCPECRGSLRNISRYGRIVRRGLLDESTKKFTSWSQSKWQAMSKALLDAKDALQSTDRTDFVMPAEPSGGFDLRGSRQSQATHLLNLTGAKRHKSLKRLRHQISHFVGLVKRDEQPYQRVAHLVWHVNKRRKTSGFSFDESAIQMGGLLQATCLLLRCDLLLISDYVALCRSLEENAAAKAVKVEAAPYMRDCRNLIQIAHARDFHRLEVEGHILLVMFCSFSAPDDTMQADTVGPDGDNGPGQDKLRDLGEHHLQVAKDRIRQWPSTAALKPELETAGRMLHDGVFYTEISVDEMRDVYAAMSKELRGTGHWYTCRNGHPFTIGECGMAMERARCPECDAPVGGQNHTSAEGVRHATDIEELARGMGSMGL
ncbi:NFX1-type zinc finger-containing protein 1 [Colletotrichum higginsianum]|uniref:NFX1-type zinc finger-containing protein 1 n=1 Tax=Colletotrichum higginsianum TaxID=80884 RepID=A0A4V4NB04_9PEZI|nr:NFX1-type zinc finger-containing protein 1 [Colletotrichum higginsianum]